MQKPDQKIGCRTQPYEYSYAPSAATDCQLLRNKFPHQCPIYTPYEYPYAISTATSRQLHKNFLHNHLNAVRIPMNIHMRLQPPLSVEYIPRMNTHMHFQLIPVVNYTKLFPHVYTVKYIHRMNTHMHFQLIPVVNYTKLFPPCASPYASSAATRCHLTTNFPRIYI
jgi:hypothetical protein